MLHLPAVQREDKQRSKAFKASAKQAKPLWEEDGKRRGLLDKYDEEEEQMMRVRLCCCCWLGGRLVGWLAGLCCLWGGACRCGGLTASKVAGCTEGCCCCSAAAAALVCKRRSVAVAARGRAA